MAVLNTLIKLQILNEATNLDCFWAKQRLYKILCQNQATAVANPKKATSAQNRSLLIKETKCSTAATLQMFTAQLQTN